MPDPIHESIVIRNAAVALPEGIRHLDIGMRNGKIDQIDESLTGYHTEINADQCTVIPGMMDIHTHGAARVDCNNASVVDLQKLSAFFASEGVTGFVPTIISDTEARMVTAIRQIADARQHVQGAKILGCHLEGPFLSSEYKGAMPRRHLKAGDTAMISRFLLAARSCKLRMTVSPEVQGVEALLHYIVSQGILVSLGHSGATYEQTFHCLQAGANCFTLAMNAMRPLDRREPGILGAALESDAYCEFICDGLHVHPANIRLLYKTKGLSRLVAVSDSMMATGLEEGTYRLGTQTVTVRDGNAILKGSSTRAGSMLTLRKALINFMHYTGLPLHQAVLPFTASPAAVMQLDTQKGRIAVGMDADLAVLDAHRNVLYTIVGQRIVFKQPAQP